MVLLFFYFLTTRKFYQAAILKIPWGWLTKIFVYICDLITVGSPFSNCRLCVTLISFIKMKKLLFTAFAALVLSVIPAYAAGKYLPSEEVKLSQKEFSADRFGIFIHWGIYSMFGQGEWYLNYGVNAVEYAKAAKGFYPIDFDAGQWARAIKDSGAKYICFTSRHHDGFSMWDTRHSDYNIVKSTPFKRDIIKELSEACKKEDLKLHLYYSHLDWTRPV